MSELQLNQTPTLFSLFADWCLYKDNLSTVTRYIAEVLLKKAGTFDCYQPERLLIRYTQRHLSDARVVIWWVSWGI